VVYPMCLFTRYTYTDCVDTHAVQKYLIKTEEMNDPPYVVVVYWDTSQLKEVEAHVTMIIVQLERRYAWVFESAGDLEHNEVIELDIQCAPAVLATPHPW
jgi:hypothetical protein